MQRRHVRSLRPARVAQPTRVAPVLLQLLHGAAVPLRDAVRAAQLVNRHVLLVVRPVVLREHPVHIDRLVVTPVVAIQAVAIPEEDLPAAVEVIAEVIAVAVLHEEVHLPVVVAEVEDIALADKNQII